MARPLKPLVKSGGYYPSNRWIPLVYPGGYTTANGGEQPEPEAVLKTVTGSLIHITDALAMPAKALTVNVEPIQDLHGYDNPWPAGGGKNKLPYPYYTQDGTLSGVTFSTAQDGKITASGTTTEGVNFFLARDISLAAGTYTLSIDGTHTALSLLARNSDTNIMLASIAPSKTTATFTLEETANVRLYFNTSAVGVSVSISAYVQLEAGSTATAYAPYSNICPISGRTSVTIYHSGADTSDPTTYTIQLGDTVYGGTLDVTGGKMVADMKYDQMTYAYLSNLGSGLIGFTANLSLFGANSVWVRNWKYTDYPKIIIGGIKAVCNAFRVSMHNKTLSSSQYRTYFDVGTMTSVAEFLSTVQTLEANGDGLWIAHELKTPIEITLTPTQIDTLLGTNNLWSDAGDSTLTYYAEGETSTSEALGILLGGTYNNPGGADDASDDEALGILLGGS